MSLAMRINTRHTLFSSRPPQNLWGTWVDKMSTHDATADELPRTARAARLQLPFDIPRLPAPHIKACLKPMTESDPSQLVRQMYQSPIPETSNVRYVENRILIDAPHSVVFDYVTTWGNLPKWLPVAKNVYVRKGELNTPAKLGDVLCEGVHHEEAFSAVATRADKIYTVVLHVPGFLWGVAGVDDVGDPWIGKTATFITTPYAEGKTLFCRVFQQIRKEGDDSKVRHPVLQPEVMQKGLERLKDLVEATQQEGIAR